MQDQGQGQGRGREVNSGSGVQRHVRDLFIFANVRCAIPCALDGGHGAVSEVMADSVMLPGCGWEIVGYVTMQWVRRLACLSTGPRRSLVSMGVWYCRPTRGWSGRGLVVLQFDPWHSTVTLWMDLGIPFLRSLG